MVSHRYGLQPGVLESIMGVIGKLEVRIIEGNCVDHHKAWRKVKKSKIV